MDRSVISVLDHGAQPGSAQLQTVALQSAPDAAAQCGGGTVEVPAGT